MKVLPEVRRQLKRRQPNFGQLDLRQKGQGRRRRQGFACQAAERGARLVVARIDRQDAPQRLEALSIILRRCCQPKPDALVVRLSAAQLMENRTRLLRHARLDEPNRLVQRAQEVISRQANLNSCRQLKTSSS
ncbi:MAG: hypothetical protein CUN49_07565 [Candidatus Thermofonsia Clade 1 bacterium]|uniref:Uncharacterized protein n=1 Tax=Candidatus Thermofonsia Clade 1 bacterium TaxID=2364210 RepID=A0A2M8PET4_9CHLR|nr:MAG: hypothetical protein CUN49_07565 [Candidatus Thermofonsia Clade 1 bacterium]RMF52351.1 MAG: hypothetical protein D6749_05300 [Chloroflexota bacterium]